MLVFMCSKKTSTCQVVEEGTASTNSASFMFLAIPRERSRSSGGGGWCPLLELIRADFWWQNSLCWTPGSHTPNPWITPVYAANPSFLGLLGYLGYVPGVCWNFLR